MDPPTSAFGGFFADLGARVDRVLTPDDVDEVHRHLSPAVPALAELAAEKARQKAERHHALDDEAWEAQGPRHISVRVVILAGAGERLAHLERDPPRRGRDGPTTSPGDLEPSVDTLLAIPVDDEAIGRFGEKA